MKLRPTLLAVVCWLALGAFRNTAAESGNAGTAKTNAVSFDFPAGDLQSFVDQLQRSFQVPAENVRVHRRFRSGVSVPRFQVQAGNYMDVLEAYNRMAQTNASLGRWIVPDAGAQSRNTQIQYVREGLRSGGRFEFAGGPLDNFVNDILFQFGVDLTEIGTVPDLLLYSIHSLPKMRVKTDDYTQVLRLYNDCSKEMDYSAGRWLIHTQDNEPAVIALVAGTKPSGDELSLRAFGLRLSEESLSALRDTVEKESRDLVNDRLSHGLDHRAAQGALSYHAGTGILIAKGGKAYVDLVAEIVGAYQESAHSLPAAARLRNANGQ